MAIEQQAQASELAIEVEGEAFVHHVSADAKLYPFVVGKEGRTRQRIEHDSGATLLIPSRRQAAARHLTIRGSAKESVLCARAAVDAVISAALASRALEYSHFVSLPLATPTSAAALASFQQAVLSEPSAAAAGIDASLFTPPAHLHLTLVMLKLYSDESRAVAQEALLSLRARVQEILAPGRLRVKLSGLHNIRGSSSQAHVLYTDVVDAEEGSGAVQRLRQLCEATVEAFSRAGLVLPADLKQPVKLHCTLLNTRYRQYRWENFKAGGQRRTPSDPPLAAPQQSKGCGQQEGEEGANEHVERAAEAETSDPGAAEANQHDPGEAAPGSAEEGKESEGMRKEASGSGTAAASPVPQAAAEAGGGKRGSSRRGGFERAPINAEQLLERFGGIDLGVVPIDAMHLSQRGAYGPTGYYNCVTFLPLLPA